MIHLEELNSDEFNAVLMSEGILDINHGISQSFFLQHVVSSKLQERKSDYNLQELIVGRYNEWFTSEVDSLMIGSYCAKSFDSGGLLLKTDLIDTDIIFSRDHLNSPLSLLFSVQISKYQLTKAQSLIWRKQNNISQFDVLVSFFVEIILSSKDTTIVPTTVSSLVVLCIGEWNMEVKIISEENKLSIRKSKKLFMILSVQIGNKSMDKISIKNLISSTKNRVEQGVDLGITELKLRHISKFSERMNRVTIELESHNESLTCPIGLSDNRIDSFYSGCSTQNYNNSVDLLENIDLNLVSNIFQYGRYLLISAGSASLSNLQGIWADGKIQMTCGLIIFFLRAIICLEWGLSS
jgi:hypothetical protein